MEDRDVLYVKVHSRLFVAANRQYVLLCREHNTNASLFGNQLLVPVMRGTYGGA